jgi:DNA transformation protein
MKSGQSFLEYVMDEVFQDIPGVTSRAMFGGWGLYQQGLIFGLIVADKLYFKVDKENQPDYEKAKSKPFTYHRKDGKTTAMSYWLVPEKIMNNEKQLNIWLVEAVAVSKRAKKK